MAPSSVSTVSSATHGPVSLPLLKLSHCTTSTPGANMLWTHLPNRDDMFAVFDQVRRKCLDGTVSDKKVLKLVRAGELLVSAPFTIYRSQLRKLQEQIELDTLLHQVRMDEERARSQAIHQDNLYILIIVKKPLLALRYQLPDGQIRRIQMNFQPASGFDIAFNTFESIGLPVRYKDQSAKHQIHPSSQGALHSSLPRSQEMARPFVTAYGNLPASSMPSQGQLLASPARLTSTVSHSLQPMGALPNSDYDTIRPSAQPSQGLSRPTSRTALAIDEMTADEFSKPISHIQDPRTRLGIVQGNYHARNNTGRPSSSSAVFDARSQTAAITAAAPSIPPRLLPSASFDSQLSASDRYDTRPMSAPETQSAHYLTDSLPISQMLPPRRELPFPERPEKPASQDTPISSAPKKGKATSKSKSKLADSKAPYLESKAVEESLMAARSSDGKMAKLVCPDCGRNDFKSAIGLLLHCNSQHGRGFTSTDAAVEASIRGRCADTEELVSSEHPKASKVWKQDQAPSLSAPKLRAKKAACKKQTLDTPPPSSAPPCIDTTRERSDRRCSPIDDSLAFAPKLAAPKKRPTKRSKTVQGIESNKQPGQAANEDNQPVVGGQLTQAAPSLSNIAPTEFLDSLDGWIRKYENLQAPKPPQTAKEQLAKYAKHSDEDRVKAIDNMICECLEDENFIKLVEDVEGAWRRIGLGF